mmetsp:Transcript_1226/g.3430  ORF Transcript_1226/g.3430 Transcript_1226/m.3430 type:complete len:392 (+) Transcript_1226:63-1238(+)
MQQLDPREWAALGLIAGASVAAFGVLYWDHLHNEAFHAQEQSHPPLQLPSLPISLRWVHIPKAGQSFFNTVLLYGSRNNATLVEAATSYLQRYGQSKQLQQVYHALNLEDPNLTPLLRRPIYLGHAGLRGSELGAAVALFRQPRQRLLSFCASRSGVLGSSEFNECIKQSVAGHLGVVTYQLTGWAVGNSNRAWRAPNKSRVRDAIQRLVRGFAFIGLQEEWGTSVQLFHAMFMPGVAVMPAELLNVHETSAARGSNSSHLSWQQRRTLCERRDRYGEAVFDELPPDLRLRLAQDPDQILYAIARVSFCNQLRVNGIGIVKGCHQPCPVVHISREQAKMAQAADMTSLVRQAATSLLQQWGLHNSSLAPVLLHALEGGQAGTPLSLPLSLD